MPDPAYPAIPQAFNFGGRNLNGYVLGFNGQKKRRYALHEYPKRKRGRVEDMSQSPQRLTMRLVFTGDTCARDYKAFSDAVDANPYGLVVHPIFGRWQAYCEGPQEDVDLGRATDMISITVEFLETEPDSAIAQETPDVQTASQEVTAQQSATQIAVAQFMGALAKAQTAEARALAALDTALSSLDVVTAPVDFMRTSVLAVATAQSTVIGKVTTIAEKTDVLMQDISSLVDSTTDLFDGSEVSAAASASVDTLLGVVQEHAEDLEDYLISVSATPAGAADAVGSTEESVASCMALGDALAAARPPVISYTVPDLSDVISIAQHIKDENELARSVLAIASDILSLNRIPNPAAIPSGTILLVPLE